MDVGALRSEFPGLSQEVNGHPLAYLDNAATTQKPRAVIDALVHSLTWEAANVHRGVHTLSQRASASFDAARATVARFMGASDPDEVVFTRGTTEALNLLAFGLPLAPGDEVLVSAMEHHSNLVPWQQACARTGATLRAVPVRDDGSLDEVTFAPETKVLSIVHASNTLGTVNPVADLARRARARGITVVVDGAQYAPHGPIDVAALDVDAYAFSGHKLYGPTGVGALWLRRPLRDALPPWQTGGGTIRSVHLDHTEFAEAPARFEAGTPAVAEVIALAAAIRWLDGVGWGTIAAHEASLMAHLAEGLATVPGLRRIGVSKPRVALASFVFDGIHPHDVGTLLDLEGIAIRAGHHCTEPVMRRFEVAATARISLAAYNTHDEIDRAVAALKRVPGVLR